MELIKASSIQNDIHNFNLIPLISFRWYILEFHEGMCIKRYKLVHLLNNSIVLTMQQENIYTYMYVYVYGACICVCVGIYLYFYSFDFHKNSMSYITLLLFLILDEKTMLNGTSHLS